MCIRDRPWGSQVSYPWVDVDGAAGTRLATEHLLRRGHQVIGFVGWPPGSGVGEDRRAGWLSTLDSAGIGHRPEAAVFDGAEGGRVAAARLLDGDHPPTAFVCASDSLAVGVVTELRERGRHPGADASVIGFDDTPAAGVLGLSSIAQPIAEVAAECVRHLRAVLDGETPTPLSSLLPPRLVLRQT